MIKHFIISDIDQPSATIESGYIQSDWMDVCKIGSWCHLEIQTLDSFRAFSGTVCDWSIDNSSITN